MFNMCIIAMFSVFLAGTGMYLHMFFINDFKYSTVMLEEPSKPQEPKKSEFITGCLLLTINKLLSINKLLTINESSNFRFTQVVIIICSS